MREVRRIHFAVSLDAEEFPSVEAESLPAIDLGDGEYEITGVPFHARKIAAGDVVSARAIEGRLEYESTLRDAGHSTLRVDVFDLNLAPSCRKGLVELGCRVLSKQFDGLLAVDVPPEVDLNLVYEYLDRGEIGNLWSCEDACIRLSGKPMPGRTRKPRSRQNDQQ